MGYPCLPVHDSFLTFKSLDEELSDIMRDVVGQITGAIGYTEKKDSVLYGKSQSLESAEYDIEDILDSMTDRERRWFSKE